MKVLFTGGGTGGHLYPALALAEKLIELRPDAEVRFAGTRRGIEARVLPRQGYELDFIEAAAIKRSLKLDNLRVPGTLLRGVRQAAAILQSYRPDCVVGTGGYASGPVTLAAWAMSIPVVIQEQNSYPGVTTRLLARFASQIHLGAGEARWYLPWRRNTWAPGNPVRGYLERMSEDEGKAEFGLRKRGNVLLVFGGSQGAASLNRVVAEVQQSLREQGWQVLWATGPNSYDQYKHLADRKRDFQILPYITNMAAAYAASTLAITRAGASTLAELALAGLPSVLVPFPFAAANHQEHNARAYERQGAAVVLLDRELSGESLLSAIRELAAQPMQIQAMAEAMKRQARPNAAEDIIRSVLALVETEGGD